MELRRWTSSSLMTGVLLFNLCLHTYCSTTRLGLRKRTVQHTQATIIPALSSVETRVLHQKIGYTCLYYYLNNFL